jgi:hypothetical protein
LRLAEGIPSVLKTIRSPWGRRAAHDGVTIYPIEQLGNQLFIYAAGLAQARRLGVPCYANCAFYGENGPRRDFRKSYDLDRFESGLTVLEDERYHKPIIPGIPTPLGAAWHNQIARYVPSKSDAPVFMERGFSYDRRIEGISEGTTILGYFQSWRYFADIAGEIRERILLTPEASHWQRAMSREIKPGSRSIVLNVRRGNYRLKRHLDHHGLAMRDYYARAIHYLRRLGLDGSIYVASDSLQDAMAELDGISELNPIDPPGDVSPFGVLQLLARADGFVAANSSFSWWAGFLGDDRGDHVVIAPRPWFTAPGLDTRDLLPRSWLTIDRD